MDQQKRLLVAIALSFGLTLVWTQFVWKPQAEAEAAALAAKLDGGVTLVDGGLNGAVVIAQPAVVDADAGVVGEGGGPFLCI